VEVATIEARAKAVDSFVEKLHRKGQKYANPLADMTDLAGARIITYYVEDLTAVGSVIAAEFEIDEANSMNPAQSMEPDKFGYAAPSYVISLSSPRKELSEWAPFAAMRAEVQVRTIAQHAWSALDHKLRYKRDAEAPVELHRDLSRLSALFELADKEFSNIRKRSQEITERYSASIAEGNYEISLNLDSLVAYFSAAGWMTYLAELAESSGWQSVRQHRDVSHIDADLAVRIVNASAAAGMTDLAQLDDWLQSLPRWAPPAAADIALYATEAGFQPYAHPEDVATMLLLYWARLPPEVIQTFYVINLATGISKAISEAPDEL
jgi:putative GTP pyrophosphokinase